MGAFAWERYRTRALVTVGRGHVTSGTQSIAFHIIVRVRDGATFSLLRGCYALGRMARRLFQNSRAPEFQSSRAPELRSSKAPELQSFRVRYALFSHFFQDGGLERHVWWFIVITTWLLRSIYTRMALFFFFQILLISYAYEDENLPRLGTRACSEKTAFSLIQQVRCLQVMANISGAGAGPAGPAPAGPIISLKKKKNTFRN